MRAAVRSWVRPGTQRCLLDEQIGSSGSSMIQLERDGMDIVWLSLDRSRTTITGMEVLDGHDLGPNAQQSG